MTANELPGILFHALPESARSLEVTFGLEQGFESEDRVRIAAPARALHRHGGTDEILAGREEDAQAERSSWMAGCVGEFVGAFCPGEVTVTLEQAAEVERAVRVATLSCVLVAGPRLVQISALFEEDPEIDSRGGMAQRICLPICAFGGGEITALLEPDAEIEPLDAVAVAGYQ